MRLWDFERGFLKNIGGNENETEKKITDSILFVYYF
jgi:hypothetical protein